MKIEEETKKLTEVKNLAELKTTQDLWSASERNINIGKA